MKKLTLIVSGLAFAVAASAGFAADAKKPVAAASAPAAAAPAAKAAAKKVEHKIVKANKTAAKPAVKAAETKPAQ